MPVGWRLLLWTATQQIAIYAEIVDVVLGFTSLFAKTRQDILPAMFAWPRFSAHLCGVRSPAERVASLLADLAEYMPTASAKDVLSTFFEHRVLVDALEPLASHVDHVGFIAPHGIEAAAAEEALRESPFRYQLRQFRSAVLAKELSLRLGWNVGVVVVQGSVAAPPARSLAVEIFVADVPALEIDSIIAQETGCHVALALDPRISFDRIREVLHANGCWENALMRDGPLVNQEISSALLYLDIPGRERTRRLEFIGFNAA